MSKHHDHRVPRRRVEVADPAAHPAPRLIGTAEREAAPRPAFDVAREHDRALMESEVASWQPPRRKPRGR